MKHTARGPAAAATVLAVGLVLLFFWKIIFTNLILVGVDSYLYFYPYRAYVTQALLEGRFPLWNPHLFLGAPLFANMQTAVLYPLHWPLLWLSVPRQVAVSIVLHVILAAGGMLAYARRALKLRWSAALAATVAFALGGFLGGQAEHINQLNCIAWLPWALLLLDRVVTADPTRAGFDIRRPAGDSVSTTREQKESTQAQRTRRLSVFSSRSLSRGGFSHRTILTTLGLAWVIALMILAGHAQTVFICLTGLALYALLRPAPDPHGLKRWTAIVTYLRRYPLAGVVALMAAAGLAALMTAAQLLPTLELSGLSVRSSGLTYREATSFSLNPWLLHYTLLPPYAVDLSHVFGAAYSEYIAYVGVVGLGMALFAAWRGWRHTLAPAGFDIRQEQGQERLPAAARFFSLLAGVGLFLALGRINPIYYLLYRLAPGFDTFRAPARWMLLYAFGIAMLAGIGLEWVARFSRPTSGAGRPGLASRLRTGRWLGVALLIVLCGELLVASRTLRSSQPTAPEAFTFVRPSIAHLQTDPGLHRFLSLSGIVYDPGNLAEMRTIFAGQQSERALYDYVVAAKEKEVLFYNLPLLYGFYSVDGYDGGLLPLRNFVAMQRLFLPEDQLSVDGRLREKLVEVPPGRLLSLLGVKYVITDKVYDVWIDGVFYDLQFSARLGRGSAPRIEAAGLPDFPTTALGVVSYLDGAAAVSEGTPVARIRVADDAGWSHTFDLLAGTDTSEGKYGPEMAHRQARVGHTWRDDPTGSDYIALLPLDGARRLTRVVVEATLPAGQFVLRGLSLVDVRTRTSQQLTLSTDGQYRLVHSGDVKIYENLGVLPRAFVVHRAEVVAGDSAVIARLREPAFNAAETVLLASGEPLSGSGAGKAEITSYAPEEITVDASTDAPGYLALTDTWYPGWEATVDGQTTPILRADLMFRAVRLPPGRHTVEFRYRPQSVRTGVWVSVAATAVWLGMMIWCIARARRTMPADL